MTNKELKKKIVGAVQGIIFFDELMYQYCIDESAADKIAEALIEAGIGDVAELRERLKAREKSVCLGTEWKAVVTDEDIDEVFGIAEARLAELKGETK